MTVHRDVIIDEATYMPSPIVECSRHKIGRYNAVVTCGNEHNTVAAALY